MIIETTIKTPQFKGGKVKDYTIQEGTISTINWIFEPKSHVAGSVGKHTVHFKDEADWNKYKIK